MTGAVEDGHGRRSWSAAAGSRLPPGPGRGPGAGDRAGGAACRRRSSEAPWWEAHIVEVVDGMPPDAPAGTLPRPEYDPERTSLTGREQAKAAELSAAGQPVTASTVKHRRQRWQADGPARHGRPAVPRRRGPAGRATIRSWRRCGQAIAEATDDSSRTAAFVFWRTREILAGTGQAGAGAVGAGPFTGCSPGCRRGRHTTGSAVDPPVAGGPAGAACSGRLPAAAPGEVMQIDSTPLDVLVLLDNGVPGRVELTGHDRRGDQDGARGGAAADDEVGGRERAAGPGPHAGADAAGLAARPWRWRTRPCRMSGC